jgi:hypothetical protein
MERVEFYLTTYKGQEKIGEVIYDGEKVHFEGLPSKMVKNLIEKGVWMTPKKGPFFPKDGRIFLEALRYEYSGSYLRASRVIKDVDDPHG